MAIRIRQASAADEAAIDQWQRSITSVDEFIALGGGMVRDSEAVRQRFREWLRLPRERKVPAGWERMDLVAVEEHRAICGYAAVLFGPEDRLTGQPEAYVSELHVWPNYRDKGVATALLEMAEAHAVQRGVPYLSIHVPTGNKAALELFTRSGFMEETTRLSKRIVRPEG